MGWEQTVFEKEQATLFSSISDQTNPRCVVLDVGLIRWAILRDFKLHSELSSDALPVASN